MRDVVSPSSAGDSILVTPLPSAAQRPSLLLLAAVTLTRPVVLGWAGGELNKDDVTTFSGDKSADWDAVILRNRFSQCWNAASVNSDYNTDNDSDKVLQFLTVVLTVRHGIGEIHPDHHH